MPIPLPDDRDILRRVYEDASAIAAAIGRHIDEIRRVKQRKREICAATGRIIEEIGGISEPHQEGVAGVLDSKLMLISIEPLEPSGIRRRQQAMLLSELTEVLDAERRLNDPTERIGPHEAWERVRPYLEIPSHRATEEARNAWFKQTIIPIIEAGNPGNSRFDWLIHYKRMVLDLRDAALWKLNEAAATPVTTTGRQDASITPPTEAPGESKSGKGKPTGSNAGQASDAGKNEPKALTLDDLTPAAWKLLRALRDSQAFNSDSGVTQQDAAMRANTGNASSEHNRNAFRAMKELGLIESRRNSGTWLTKAGLKAVEPR